MHSTVKPSFRYRLEKQKPRIGSGGTTRGASVHEFPASIGIAGVGKKAGARDAIGSHEAADREGASAAQAAGSRGTLRTLRSGSALRPLHATLADAGDARRSIGFATAQPNEQDGRRQ